MTASGAVTALPNSGGGAAAGAAAGRHGPSVALYHPTVYKHRFCASFPNILACRRGEACAFAHTRQEIRTPLLEVAEEAQQAKALTDDFFMYRFKTFWCPIGVQHDWQNCVYAHNYQDARRNPGIGYGPRPCPYWKRKETALEYGERCPLGVRCPYSHGAKEQLYHPAYFKTVTCQDWPNSKCPRGRLCAFWHKRWQQRGRQKMMFLDDERYKDPLFDSQVQESLQRDFLSPPFKLLNALQADAFYNSGTMYGANGIPMVLDANDAGHYEQIHMFPGQQPLPPNVAFSPAATAPLHPQQAEPAPGNSTFCSTQPAVGSGACCGPGAATPSTAAGVDADEEAGVESTGSTAGSDKSLGAVPQDDEKTRFQQSPLQGGLWPLSPQNPVPSPQTSALHDGASTFGMCSLQGGLMPAECGLLNGDPTMCYMQGLEPVPMPLQHGASPGGHEVLLGPPGGGAVYCHNAPLMGPPGSPNTIGGGCYMGCMANAMSTMPAPMPAPMPRHFDGMPMESQLMVFSAGGQMVYTSPPPVASAALCEGKADGDAPWFQFTTAAAPFADPSMPSDYVWARPRAATEPQDDWLVRAPEDAGEDMPTYNGFIHFKDATEGSDVDEAPVGRRPRANSH